MSKWWWPVAGAAIAVAPVVAQSPRPVVANPEGVLDLEDAVRVCRASGLTGWELVAYAQNLVHRKFTRFSILNLYETPRRAFRNSRGYANQYNTALWLVLRDLGFQTRRVFATRVRQDINPWWRMGHTWVQVTIDGRTLDVCASRADNRPGQVHFVPVTDVQDFHGWTYLNTNNGMILFTVYEAWKSMLTRKPLPRWMFREFGSTAREG